MSQAKEEQLGNASIGRLLFQLAVPAVAAQIVNVLYNMVDRMFIGHIPDIGSHALTGVGVCMPVILSISAFAALAAMGGAPRASIMMGKGNKKQAEKILGNCTTVLIIISALLTVLFLLFGNRLLFLFGASSNTIGYAADYMYIYVCGTIFVQLSLGLNAFVTTQGFSKVSMYTVVIGAVCNIILDPIFIFGFHMGVKGAALATVIAQALSTLWVLRFLTGKRTLLRLELRHMRLSAKIILPCLALGLSPFVMQITESVLSVCFNASLLKYGGDLAVGAMTICATVRQFVTLPLMGLTQGAQPIISYNFGAGNGERVRKTFRLLLIVSIIYTIIMWLIAIFAPQAYVFLFSKDPSLTDITTWALRIYMAAIFSTAVQNACQQTFVALGNAKTSLFLAIQRKLILLIPLIYILPLFFADKVMAVYLAEPVADFIAAATTGTMFWLYFRKVIGPLQKAA